MKEGLPVPSQILASSIRRSYIWFLLVWSWRLFDPDSLSYCETEGSITPSGAQDRAGGRPPGYNVFKSCVGRWARSTQARSVQSCGERMLEVWPAYADYQKRTEREIPVVVLERL